MGNVSDGLDPNLVPQSVAGLPARDNIPLLAFLQNKSANSAVASPSPTASSTGKVKLPLEDFGSGTGTTSWTHAIDQLDSLSK